MGDDKEQGSTGTDVTAERIYPARTLVKSPQLDLENPFNSVFGRRRPTFTSSFSPRPTDKEELQSTPHDSSTETVKPELGLGTGQPRDARLDHEDRGKQPSTQAREDAGKEAVVTDFEQLDRVLNNEGTVRVHDVASTRPVEKEVEDEFEHRTRRFEHRVSDDGVHQILTGLDDDKLQACEDEPIHIPGAVQGFGVLLTLRQVGGNYQVVHVSEVLGLSPKYLFALQSFTDLLDPHDLTLFMDQLDFLEDSNSSDHAINAANTSSLEAEGNVSPEVFLLSGHQEDRSLPLWKCWAAVHRTLANGDLFIVEFEVQHDQVNPLALKRDSPAPLDPTLEPDREPERGISAAEKSGMAGDGFGAFSEEDLMESTQSASKPLRRVRRSVLMGNEDGTMEIFTLLSQINTQLSAATDLQTFLKVVVGLVKEITSFHRVLLYQFDEQWNGQVVAELVDWNETKDLFQGLSFPATDIPEQARALYKINKVRTLYDRDQPTARLVCRDGEALKKPVDMTHCFLRAMSPIHLKYLANMGVRASMSISITAFGELWGLIACHTYGDASMRCSFLIRKLCRLMAEQISHNIERLSYAARLTSRKLIHSPNDRNPSGYIVSKAEDLLGLFDADMGMLSIGDEGKILGGMENSQEAIVLREYFRSKRLETITPSSDLRADFPDLTYEPGFRTIAGVMYIPLSRSGEDFLLFFRRGHLRKVHWAGNPYEKILEKNKGHASVLLPRQSFKVWSESVIGRCKDWGEDQIETAAVLCIVYGKFIEVWREKQQVVQTSKLATLLLNNAGHEVRTPLNAVINYLEIAMEGELAPETRENLERSHTASKSLVYVINDLLDLTKSEQGQDLFRNEPFDLLSTVREAASLYQSQASRASVHFALEEDESIPRRVLGDQGKIRQVISNVTANALKYTKKGSVTVETKALGYDDDGSVQIAIAVKDTGCGISPERLDAIFSNFELVETTDIPESQAGEKQSHFGTGLGLAIVARVVRNMKGQLKAESKVGRGSTFTFIFHFFIAEENLRKASLGAHQALSATVAKTLDRTRSGSSADGRRRKTSQINVADGSVSDTSGVEVNEATGQRSWPTDRQHAETKERMSLHSQPGSVESRSSLRQQMNTLRMRVTDAQESSQSGLDQIMDTMISGSNPSDRRDGSGEIPSLAHNSPNGSKQSLQVQFAESTLQSDARDATTASKNSGSDSLYANKQISRNSERESGTNRSKVLHSDFQSVGAESGDQTDLSTLDETTSDVGSRPSEKVANTRTMRPMRGVKVEASAVSIPQKYERDVLRRKASLGPKRQKSTEKPVSPSGAVDIGPLNILVAEDDAINRLILQKRLQIDRHKIKLAFHGADCYDEYSKDTVAYDVILMDMQMPVLDGMGATRKIRALEATCYAERKTRVPIIAVSASLLESQVDEAIAAGLDGWILKPVDFGRLKVFFSGLKDRERREADLYRPGQHQVWEKGGWFTNLEE